MVIYCFSQVDLGWWGIQRMDCSYDNQLQAERRRGKYDRVYMWFTLKKRHPIEPTLYNGIYKGWF